MNDVTKNIFVEFTKKNNDKQIVEGYASSETLDSQGEIVKLSAIEKALKNYMVYGNIRQMHQWSAVGKAISANIDNVKKALHISAKIVDKEAWEKVKEGVYNGFSIGGKVMKQIDNEIFDLTLNEISIVDRPANPDAVFTMVKLNKDGSMVDQPYPVDPPEMDDMMVAGGLIEMARNLRYLLNEFQMRGKQTYELAHALTLLKKLAAKCLTGDNAKKFHNALYNINFEELEKAKLPYKDRKDMPSSDFAYVDSKGGKHLPVHDSAHAKAAMARWNQTQFESPEKKAEAARKILAAARKFGVEIDPSSGIAQAAKKADVSEIKKFVDNNWTDGYFSDLKKVLG